MGEGHVGPLASVGSQEACNLGQKIERLPASDGIAEAWRVPSTVRPLAGDDSCSDCVSHVVQKRPIGVGDGYDNATPLAAMSGGKRDRPFAIHQSRYVRGSRGLESIDDAIALHRDPVKWKPLNRGSGSLHEPTKKKAEEPDGFPGLYWWRRRDSLSMAFATGWTMPSSCRQDAERLIRHRCRRILVSAPRRPGQRTYESLQGRPEVGPLPTPRCCHSALPR